MSAARPRLVWLIAGEESGDQLGAKLMRALKGQLGADGVTFGGVGGHAMEGEGLRSVFPLTDIAVMGLVHVVARLPSLLRRASAAVAAAAAARPDILIIIDAPDFTHVVARRVRRKLPELPIINYVSPTVWAWRPWRARKMRPYVDHILAIKPFEPEALRRLGGPACTYIGHPLVERMGELRPRPGERRPIGEDPLELLVLPGSRRSEIVRLMEPFGAALGEVIPQLGRPVSLTLPAVPHLADEIEARSRDWPVQPRIVLGEAAKYAGFRRAHAALAASGTVTLELGLAGVPMVVAYKVSWIEAQIGRLIVVPSFVLTNLVLGDRTVPEFMQDDCTPENLAAGLRPLLADTPQRRVQVDAFHRLEDLMRIDEHSPSARAARIVTEILQGHSSAPSS
ncbi:MAG TPA: lipid-A-disaccharide synthase [Beijerinckiaceae bacterium]|nr:lipid-A-disaccharide synthase [Beijerinckiaceae bacterium]